MRARWIKLACLAACSLSLSAFAGDQSITGYEGTTGQSPIKRGCAQIILVMNAYTGVIGNGTYVATTLTVPISAVGDGQVLGQLSYTVTGGHLYIIEVR
jgi:hypothetical protein